MSLGDDCKLPHGDLELGHGALDVHAGYRDDDARMFEDRIVWRATPFYSRLADWENRWVNDVTPVPVPEVTRDVVDEVTERYGRLVNEG